MQSNIKHSRQRDAILNLLRQRYDHPTAEQIYTDLKTDFPKLSLGISDKYLGFPLQVPARDMTAIRASIITLSAKTAEV